MMLPSNVQVDRNSAYTFDELNEKQYLLNIIRGLRDGLGTRFDELEFYIYSSQDARKNPLSADGKRPDRKVLFFISDESGHVPHNLKDSYLAIFKCYLPSDRGMGNIFSFPLGYVKDFPGQEIKSVECRKYDVSFAGNLNSSRLEFYMQFSRLRYYLIKCIFKIRRGKLAISLLAAIGGLDCSRRIKNSYIKFTGGFKKGLDMLDYAGILYDSKIALCPRGFQSSETFRIYESMRAGCVVVAEELPDSYFYRGSPIIQVRHWKQGLQDIRQLLMDKNKLMEIQNKSIAWWKERCSESAVASYVIEKLSELYSPREGK